MTVVASSPQQIPFARHTLGEREIQAVVECLRGDWITTGPRTREFEERFARMIGSKAAVALNSCTAAMHLALEACEVKSGDEVIVPTLTFVGTAQAALYCGATPVLVDCRTSDLTVDPDSVDAAVTSRTRAIMPMHYGGHPCDLGALAAIANDRGLAIVEDAAHVIVASYKGTRIGASGNPTCFSFHATKPFTTGEGGMLTTDDVALADRVRVSRSHGMRRDAFTRDRAADPWAYDIEGLGHKCNPTDIMSAIGLAQLETVVSEHDRRTQLAARYRHALGGRETLSLQTISSDVVHSHHLFPVLLNLDALAIDRDEVMREMNRRGISTSIHYRPLHQFPDFARRCRIDRTTNSDWVYERLVSLPLYTRLADEDVDRVAATLIEILEDHSR
jgi:dTDP-4-amino-4,6-dideoxygalactose transaminase